MLIECLRWAVVLRSIERKISRATPTDSVVSCFLSLFVLLSPCAPITARRKRCVKGIRPWSLLTSLLYIIGRGVWIHKAVLAIITSDPRDCDRDARYCTGGAMWCNDLCDVRLLCWPTPLISLPSPNYKRTCCCASSRVAKVSEWK